MNTPHNSQIQTWRCKPFQLYNISIAKFQPHEKNVIKNHETDLSNTSNHYIIGFVDESTGGNLIHPERVISPGERVSVRGRQHDVLFCECVSQTYLQLLHHLHGKTAMWSARMNLADIQLNSTNCTSAGYTCTDHIECASVLKPWNHPICLEFPALANIKPPATGIVDKISAKAAIHGNITSSTHHTTSLERNASQRHLK